MARHRSWSAHVPADATAARRRLLNAAEACLLRHGPAKTTMADVAAEAATSRATVYRYFRDRDELVLGVILRKAAAYVRWLAASLAPQERFEDTLVEGILTTVDAARSDAMLALLFAPETAGASATIAGTSEALFRLTADFLCPYLRSSQQQGGVRDEVDLDDATEWTLRTVLSLLSLPGPRRRDRDAQRAFLQTFFVPALFRRPSRT